MHTQTHTNTQVIGVLVPYHSFSTEADQWFLSTNTRPLMIAQQGIGICIVCMCVCKGSVREFICFLFLLPIIQSHSKSHDTQTGLCLYLLSLLCLEFILSIFLSFTFASRSLGTPLKVKLALNIPNILSHSVTGCSHRSRPSFHSRSKAISWIFQQHFSQVSNVTFISSVYQSHLLKGWLFWDGGWWFSPSNITLQKRALSTTYGILYKGNTHTNTRLYNPSLHAPCVARLCFCLCKITVVQVSSRQSNADRQACKRTAKHLCSPQRSFLSYNWLSCPACGFGYKTRSSSRSPLHLPGEHRGRWKVLSKTSGKVASSFKGPWMYMAHGFLC